MFEMMKKHTLLKNLFINGNPQNMKELVAKKTKTKIKVLS
jgi:hypothetical protein